MCENCGLGGITPASVDSEAEPERLNGKSKLVFFGVTRPTSVRQGLKSNTHTNNKNIVCSKTYRLEIYLFLFLLPLIGDFNGASNPYFTRAYA